MEIILASASPRRIELIKQISDHVSVIPADIDEDVFPFNADYPLPVAEAKLAKIRPNFPDKVVLAADTTVYCDGHYFGKPVDREEAREMLLFLRGKAHIVKTAVAISKGEVKISFIEESTVYFRNFSSQELEIYLDSGEYKGKAGSYGAQSPNGRLIIERVEGDYNNVVGLPIARVKQELEKIG